MAIAVDTVRRFYDALGRDDVPAVLSLFDVQIEGSLCPHLDGARRQASEV